MKLLKEGLLMKNILHMLCIKFYQLLIIAIKCTSFIVTHITVYAYDSTPEHPHCDGVSIFPNRILGVSLLEAAMFHDPWYERLEAIAAALGWPVWKVRRAGDVIFRELIIETNKGRHMAVPVAWAAYFGVRIFGGIYHAAHMQTT